MRVKASRIQSLRGSAGITSCVPSDIARALGPLLEHARDVREECSDHCAPDGMACVCQLCQSSAELQRKVDLDG